MWTNAFSSEDIGRHVAELRKEKGISQVEFAETLGISRTTLSGLENGHAVSTKVLIRAVSYLGSRLIIAPKSADVTVKETPHG